MNSGKTGIDDDFAARGFDIVGAWIMGRNMFGALMRTCLLMISRQSK
jgi:dihydrofolate reductase